MAQTTLFKKTSGKVGLYHIPVRSDNSHPPGCTERFMQKNSKSYASPHCAYIRIHVFALARDHESGSAMSRQMATWRCRVRAAPRLRRASRPRHRQPCGFHRLAGHECGLRRTRTDTNGMDSLSTMLSCQFGQYSCSPAGAHSWLGGRRKPAGLERRLDGGPGKA